ncbi:MAG: bifunctional ornithine acetyltransferase/N-acetylglutamate synthase [Spirochaetales bacterium]|nr:bifunctional ornithine acetyltransferase/N-acetylglutamate synthase [Spirochaetales bacterium]
MEKYKNKDEYEQDVELRSMLPKGFKVGVVPLEFFPIEKNLVKPLPMKLSLIVLDEETDSFGAVFTKNKFPGHPVTHGRERLNNRTIKGVIINNKISNVRCNGGLEDISLITNELGRAFSCNESLFFSSSTGIIGWKLPVNDILLKIPALADSISNESIFPLAKGIMTTDNFPKVRSAELKGGRIVAVAKGAGMIEPNMATMLLFILTDINIERNSIREILKQVMDRTFNRISIDSDQSTSDTGIIFSSKLVNGVSLIEFENSLLSICRDLATDVVRNGEGTSHVIEVRVCGAKSEKDALDIGKAIINAPLFKAAIYGNDPNLGRILQSIGDVSGNFDIDINPDILTLTMGGYTLYDNGSFILNEELENRLNSYLKECSLREESLGFPEHRKNVEIVVDLKLGDKEATVYGSDLSYEYVRENADYRS